MQNPQKIFQIGLGFLGSRQLLRAANCFETALALERRNGNDPSPKLLSFFGYTLALARRKYEQGLKLCRVAAEREFFNPDLLCNLGEIHLACGDRARAHHAFRRGLALTPNHRRICLYIREMGIRKAPPVGFLSRHNLINRVLGRALRPRP
ncbi:MAG: tetratricopeptide repeat protein [Acidobacteriota bacterium]